MRRSLAADRADQIDYHFLKGTLFELDLWRDYHLKEVDVIVESGMQQCRIEIKSGGRFTAMRSRGLNTGRP